MEQQTSQNNQEQAVQSQPVQPTQTIYIQQPAPPKQSNGLGTAGFVLALLGLIFCWVPFVDGILWLLGFIFSFIAVFRAPRGLAIAGLVLSFVAAFIMLAILGIAASL